MELQVQIKSHIASQPEPKSIDIDVNVLQSIEI